MEHSRTCETDPAEEFELGKVDGLDRIDDEQVGLDTGVLEDGLQVVSVTRKSWSGKGASPISGWRASWTWRSDSSPET